MFTIDYKYYITVPPKIRGSDMEKATHDLDYKEPATVDCLTKPIGLNFSHCLLQKPNCKYVVPIGEFYFCKHPDHKKFQKTST
jgi:hypothetical protein